MRPLKSISCAAARGAAKPSAKARPLFNFGPAELADCGNRSRGLAGVLATAEHDPDDSDFARRIAEVPELNKAQASLSSRGSVPRISSVNECLPSDMP